MTASINTLVCTSNATNNNTQSFKDAFAETAGTWHNANTVLGVSYPAKTAKILAELLAGKQVRTCLTYFKKQEDLTYHIMGILNTHYIGFERHNDAPRGGAKGETIVLI